MSDTLIQRRSERGDLWRTPVAPRPGSDWALLAIAVALAITAASYGTGAAIRGAIDTAGAQWPIFKDVLWVAGILPILLFIPAVATYGETLFCSVAVASTLGVLALSFLELFVALLQAYLFTFLTALFLGGVLEHAGHYAHEEEHHHDGHDDPGAGEEDVHLKVDPSRHDGH